jgi:hypothetical protein
MRPTVDPCSRFPIPDDRRSAPDGRPSVSDRRPSIGDRPKANGFDVRASHSSMATEPCDGCGRDVSIAGGIANLWSFNTDSTDGLTLELADGSEYFLCFACIERLPDDPSAEDVAALEPAEDSAS